MCGFTDLYFRGLKAQVLIGFCLVHPLIVWVGWLSLNRAMHWSLTEAILEVKVRLV
jgi:hypothetical protein